jgi:aldose 1-epimerase
MIWETYGKTKDGREVTRYCLQNSQGVEVRCINYGCTITHILLPEANGGKIDVVLGFESLEEYEDDKAFLGRFVGRYANRISEARFFLSGRWWDLVKNDGNNYLHGNFHRRVFSAQTGMKPDKVSFFYRSPEGEDGFPGDVDVNVTYILTEENEFIMDFSSVTSADTHINYTNHCYFNLASAENCNLEGQNLRLNSSCYLETTKELLPTGRRLLTEGAFDFKRSKPILQDIDSDDPQVQLVGGYSHCFILDECGKNELREAAFAEHPASGRQMTVYTTQPAVQFYTSNSLNASVHGKKGISLCRHGSFCLETEHFPNTPNAAPERDFPPTLLSVGKVFHETTVLKFVF